MRYENVVDAVGHTPLVRLRLPDSADVEVYAKLERYLEEFPPP